MYSALLALQNSILEFPFLIPSKKPWGWILPGIWMGSLSQFVRLTMSRFTMSLMFIPADQLRLVGHGPPRQSARAHLAEPIVNDSKSFFSAVDHRLPFFMFVDKLGKG